MFTVMVLKHKTMGYSILVVNSSCEWPNAFPLNQVQLYITIASIWLRNESEYDRSEIVVSSILWKIYYGNPCMIYATTILTVTCHCNSCTLSHSCTCHDHVICDTAQLFKCCFKTSLWYRHIPNIFNGLNRPGKCNDTTPSIRHTATVSDGPYTQSRNVRSYATVWCNTFRESNIMRCLHCHKCIISHWNPAAALKGPWEVLSPRRVGGRQDRQPHHHSHVFHFLRLFQTCHFLS